MEPISCLLTNWIVPSAAVFKCGALLNCIMTGCLSTAATVGKREGDPLLLHTWLGGGMEQKQKQFPCHVERVDIITYITTQRRRRRRRRAFALLYNVIWTLEESTICLYSRSSSSSIISSIGACWNSNEPWRWMHSSSAASNFVPSLLKKMKKKKK